MSRIRRVWSALATAMLAVLAHAAAAQSADATPALRGIVRSAEEGPMEGVVVIAQRRGDAILTAVSTNASGAYEFPRDHLRPGEYAISIRASGYELPNSSKSRVVAIAASKPATLELTLTGISDTSKLASQLTNLEWVNSFPGTAQEKDVMMRNVVNCGFCHSLERIARSTHSAEEFQSVIQRMATYEADHSSADRIQIASLPQPLEHLQWWWRDIKPISQWLATVNLSDAKTQWAYPLRVLPRPRGKATRAIVTVFPLPRASSIVHDLDVDSKGNVWFGNTAWDYIGRLNPTTGEFSEWPAPNFLPAAAPGLDRILGVLDIQVDPQDNVWAAVGGNKLAVFSPASAQWRSFDVPVVWLSPFRAPIHAGQQAAWVTGITAPPTDGKWHENAFRLDIRTGKLGHGIPLYEDKTPPVDPFHTNPFHFCYMSDQDADGNFLCTDPVGSAIVRADAATGRTRLIPTPTPLAFPRRGYRDPQNRFWFGEFFADKIGVIDLATDRITEYETGTKYLSPYYARPDRNGDVWVSSTGSDRVLRLDPKTGGITQYLMPVYYDARKVVVDLNAKMTTVWLPNKNSGTLLRIEVPD